MVQLSNDNYLANKVFIYGGNYKSSRVNSDTYTLDIRERSNGYMAEMAIKETEDVDSEQQKLPKAREGHVAFIIENQMLIHGGCDI